MSEAARKIAPVSKILGLTLLERIGNTPLLRFQRVSRNSKGIEVLAKAEWVNPGGSVKDRAAASIVADAQRTGKLGPGKTLLDSTSGNTGIAYAMLGAAEAFPVSLCIPTNVSPERSRIVRSYGAEIIYTDPGEGSDGAIRKAREIAASEPHKYFYADQYSNPANWLAHYYGTAEEIWRQTEGRITHFVAMLGTSGTFVGTSRRLKELNRNVRCVSLQPDSPFHGIEGAKHMSTSIVPQIYDETIADENLFIATEDAYAMTKRLAREEGVLVGISAAAAMVGSLRVAKDAERDSVIVTICPDGADRYWSERVWDDFEI
ncbi:MAG TPA: cysteine synthase family protein [Candidatus Binatia bacterium]|jgi:cysteine synthase B|nr:cysteine synthase family protein [Candidatus Binatia bacterium]